MAYTQTPRNKGGLGPVTFPLHSDITHVISKSYGTLVQEGPDAGVCTRATFIIDRKGDIKHLSQNDLSVGRNVDEVFRLVQAFQYVDENIVTCPSGWKKGGRTLKADHKSEEIKKSLRKSFSSISKKHNIYTNALSLFVLYFWPS